MVRKTASDEDEETGRESRLKLILLAIALALVAAYALTVTTMGDVILHEVARLLRSGTSLLWVIAVGSAIALAGLGVSTFRRRGVRVTAKAAEAGGVLKLADRKKLMTNVAAQLEAHAKSGRQLALHLIDIDRFGVINEVLGEAEGDAFLKLATERLLVLVDNPERLAKVGDDEFAIIQPEAGGVRHSELYARRIAETLKDTCAQVPRHARPGASIGIAVSPEHGKDAARLFHSAAIALRTAKKAGGDTLRVYEREMEMVVEARLQMEKALGDGLHQGWFELHFQPQYDLQSRRLTGFEALVRMNHPELGEMLPDAFLPAAEESGLIQPLGEWIVRDAFATSAQWPPHLVLTINVSPAQFRHGDAAGIILKALSNAGIDGTRLRVEISESVLLDLSGVTQDQLRRLKSRGVTIVLDDFGVDTSRLKLLASSACDAVKLDRSLVERVGEEPEMEILVRSLIGTAQSFDLDVLAEGIERPEQAHFLISNDCQKLQGYLFGRPMRAGDISAVIARDRRNALMGDDHREHTATAA